VKEATLQLVKQAFETTASIPLGVIVAAVTERLSRYNPRWLNIAIKVVVAYWLVHFSLLLGGGVYGDECADGGASSSKCQARGLLYSFARIVFLVAGVVIGTALQPVGLTGGIATGKSTVSSLFSSRQSPQTKDATIAIHEETEFIVIDVDGIAHDILLPEKMGEDSVYNRLVAEFGMGILEESKSKDTANNTSSHPPIDRRKLGDVVFSDRQRRTKLNSITHPKIIKIMLRRIIMEGLNLGRFFNISNKSVSSRRVICVDIPLLFEGGLPMRLLFGTIIVVACNPNLQLERLHKRSPDLTLEQCRQRIASQIPVEEKARKAQLVIRNDGGMQELKSQVMKVKENVSNLICGSQRGVELAWLVVVMSVAVLLTIHTNFTPWVRRTVNTV
jgi:dephospho-CoA kinase